MKARMDPLLSFLFLELRFSLSQSLFDEFSSIRSFRFRGKILIERKRTKRKAEPFRRRFDSGEFMSGRWRGEGSAPLPRIRTKRTIPLREKRIRTVVGPRLIFSSLHGKSNYSSPCAIAFGATIPFYSRLKSLNSSRVPLEFFNFLVNLVDVIRETNNLASCFSFGLGKQPDEWKP